MAHLVACQLSPPGRSCRLAINNDSHLKSPGLHVVHCGLCCMLVTGNVVSDRRHGCRAACWVVRNRTIREGLDWLFPCVLGDLRSDLTLSNRWIAETLCHDDPHLPNPRGNPFARQHRRVHVVDQHAHYLLLVSSSLSLFVPGSQRRRSYCSKQTVKKHRSFADRVTGDDRGAQRTIARFAIYSWAFFSACFTHSTNISRPSTTTSTSLRTLASALATSRDLAIVIPHRTVREKKCDLASQRRRRHDTQSREISHPANFKHTRARRTPPPGRPLFAHPPPALVFEQHSATAAAGVRPVAIDITTTITTSPSRPGADSRPYRNATHRRITPDRT